MKTWSADDDSTFWSDTLDGILADSKAKTMAFWCVWTTSVWGPTVGRSDASDFTTTVNDGKLDMLDPLSYDLTINSSGSGNFTATSSGEGNFTMQGEN